MQPWCFALHFKRMVVGVCVRACVPVCAAPMGVVSFSQSTAVVAQIPHQLYSPLLLTLRREGGVNGDVEVELLDTSSSAMVDTPCQRDVLAALPVNYRVAVPGSDYVPTSTLVTFPDGSDEPITLYLSTLARTLLPRLMVCAARHGLHTLCELLQEP